MAQARLVLVVAATVAVAGCASVQQRVRGWLGDTPGQAEQQGTPYFTAVDGLPVHAEASGAAQVVGRLALHEKVVRTRLEAGWAYVSAADGGLSGWVDNAQLIWRLPAAEPGATPAAEPGASAEQTPPAATTGAEPGPSVSPAAAAPAATPTPTPPATPTPAPTPTIAPPTPTPTRRPLPEQFDPY